MIQILKQFGLVFPMQVKQALHHPYAALAVMTSWVLRISLTIVFYRAIYDILHKTDIHGLDFRVAVSSMVLYALFMGTGCRQMNKTINTEYASGAMAMWLNKPIPYLLLKIAEVLGKNVLGGFGILVCIIVFWLCGNFPAVQDTPLRFLAGGVLMLLGLVIAFCLYSILGFTSFWLGDSSGPFSIVDKMVMLFGGSYIPVAFFPKTLRLIGESLPMGAMTSVSQMFFPDFLANFPRFLALQLFWLLVLGTALSVMYRRAEKRLTVNGG